MTRRSDGLKVAVGTRASCQRAGTGEAPVLLAHNVRRLPIARLHVVPRVPWSASGRWRPKPTTLAILLIGLWLFGTGEALLVASHLGNTPWTVLAQGFSRHSPLSIGGATLVISVVVLLGWLPLREVPGLGTLANAVVI